MLSILYEDRDIIVCIKPAGVASQNERGYQEDMVSILMNYQKENGVKAPYVGVVHRLDKMVGGVMVYAKNKKAAGELSKQIAAGQTGKKYFAVCHAEEGMEIKRHGTMSDYLVKDGKNNISRISDKDNKMSKHAELIYDILETKRIEDKDGAHHSYSLADIKLLTGRHHQIRVQFASRNMPLYGDAKYNKYFNQDMKNRGIGLVSYSIAFRHPVTGKEMKFQFIPENGIFAEFNIQKILNNCGEIRQYL